MKIHFRIASPSDGPRWIALRCELWPDCPVERHRLEMEQLASNNGVVVVAELGAEIVGFAEVSIRVDHVEGTSSAPVPYLEGWYVRENCRGQGVGRRLVEFVEHWAMERGFRELASDAEIENDYSVRLHSQLGFAEVGRTVHFVKKLRPNAAEHTPGAPLDQATDP